MKSIGHDFQFVTPSVGAEILFWFWFYKYAAPTALGTNAVPKSFCVGRLGHLAFECLDCLKVKI
jgi:hypothetical protein